MPCSTCASRFEEQDKPDFIKAVHKLNPNIKVIATNAQGSDATQIAQIQDALVNGAKVIVISPLRPVEAASRSSRRRRSTTSP